MAMKSEKNGRSKAEGWDGGGGLHLYSTISAALQPERDRQRLAYLCSYMHIYILTHL
jgi:hypothetical protein